MAKEQVDVKVVEDIEQVPVTSINMAAYNPRTASQGFLEKLVRSIQEHGFVDPVIVNKRSEGLGFTEDLGFKTEQVVPTVVGGHQRIKAATILGMEKVPVVWVELSPVAERELNVALNKIEADWEGQLLAETLRWIDEHGGNIGITGFEEHEYKRLMEAAAIEAPDEFPDVDVDASGFGGGGQRKQITCPSCGYDIVLEDE